MYEFFKLIPEDVRREALLRILEHRRRYREDGGPKDKDEGKGNRLIRLNWLRQREPGEDQGAHYCPLGVVNQVLLERAKQSAGPNNDLPAVVPSEYRTPYSGNTETLFLYEIAFLQGYIGDLHLYERSASQFANDVDRGAFASPALLAEAMGVDYEPTPADYRTVMPE